MTQSAARCHEEFVASAEGRGAWLCAWGMVRNEHPDQVRLAWSVMLADRKVHWMIKGCALILGGSRATGMT
jgi:hypothetical protein